MNPLIAEARNAAPFSDDGGLLMRLASALESAEKTAEAALADLADGGRV